MRKSILNFFIAFITVCTVLQAQSISGSVTDSEDGEPLAGVNIVVQGQNQGAVSDFDGNFTIPNFLLKLAAIFVPSLRLIASRLGSVETLHTKNANNILGWYPKSVDSEIVNSAKQLYDVGILKK